MATVATAPPGGREALHRVTAGGGAAGGSSSHRSHAAGTSSAAATTAGIAVPEGFVASSFFAEQPFFSESPPPSPEQETTNGTAAAAAVDREGQQPLLQLFRDLTRRDWLERMSEVDIYERDLHRLILNFFTVHGYEEAAEAFSKEAGMEPEMPVESIARRSHIKEAVLHGRMEEAIHLINLVDTKILPSNPEIDFLLKQQQLLHLIEEGDTCAAIDFAQQQLAPCVKQHPDLLPKLEEAMALLAFNDLKCAEAQHLLGGMDQREQTARRIDEAILDFFNVEQESALETLTKNVVWTQKQIQKRHPGACPVISDVATGMMTSPTAAEKPSSCSSSTTVAATAQQQQDAGSRVERRASRRSSSRRPPHVEEAEGDSNGSEEEGAHAAAGGSSSSAAGGGGTSAAGGGASGGTTGGGGSGATAAGTASAPGRGGTAATAGNPPTHSGSGAGGARSGNRPAIRSGPPSVLSSRRTYHSERGRRDVDRRRRDAS